MRVKALNSLLVCLKAPNRFGVVLADTRVKLLVANQIHNQFDDTQEKKKAKNTVRIRQLGQNYQSNSETQEP